MLLNLFLQNFLLVDKATIEFTPGMTVLSGETGAGKSILINALSLVLGARGSSDWIKKPQNQAEIRAEFDISQNRKVKAKLAELEIEQEGELVLRRLLNISGRSKSFINDIPVSLGTVKTVGQMLVDIYGQHSHQALARADFQRQKLDEFGQIDSLVNRYKDKFQALQNLKLELKELTKNSQQTQDRLELLKYQLDEFAKLDLQENEFAELELEQKQLSKATEVVTGLRQADEELTASDSNFIARLEIIQQELNIFTGTYPELSQTLDNLNHAIILLKDVSSEIKQIADKVAIDPERLNQVDGRLDLILSLARKHRVNATDLIKMQQNLKAEFASSENSEQTLNVISEQIDTLNGELGKLAGKISNKRQKAGKKLAKLVTGQIQKLGMQGASMEIAINNLPKLGSHGQDKISFILEANPGQGLSEIGSAASGGELSRLGLAVQVSTTQDTSLPVMVFDEVDAGIGGETADTVGALLKRLGQSVQVLCVTHLTQVARLADQHYRVSKSITDGTTNNSITQLKGEARVEEIARMLGSKTSNKSIQHAKELLET